MINIQEQGNRKGGHMLRNELEDTTKKMINIQEQRNRRGGHMLRNELEDTT